MPPRPPAQGSVPLRRASSETTFTIQTDEFRSQPIPGLGNHAKLGECFARVTEIPAVLERFLKVNPRSPKRSRASNQLTGPVVSAIRETLRENPDQMAIKNNGIFLLAEDTCFERAKGGVGQLTVTLADPDRHGVVNGGHTLLTILDEVESADEESLEGLRRAFVRLHFYQGIEPEQVPEMADGLNTSKQVDDPSLDNLRRHYDQIKEVMAGHPGASEIAYSQGEPGSVYITEVLTILELFNVERFDHQDHPNRLFGSKASAVKYFEEDFESRPSPLDLIIPRLPEILALRDKIHKETPAAAKEAGFVFGRMKVNRRSAKRAGSPENVRNVALPFLNEVMDYPVHKGWVLPMLAAFRANVDWDLAAGRFEWKVPLDELFPAIIGELVRICVREHKDNNSHPEYVGKKDSAYAQCYDKVVIYLARQGKLLV